MRLGLGLASLASGAAAIEGVLRLAGSEPRQPAPLASLLDRRFKVGLDCYPSNPRGYFDVDLRDAPTRDRYRAQRVRRIDRAWSVAPHAIELRYNSLQYRDAEVPPRRPGVRRVVVVGDSFTEGQGVKQDDTYPRVLETLLNGAEPGRWEVRNWGQRGADFPVLSTLFEEALRYEPDIILYGMVLNDAERPPEIDARQDYLNNRSIARRRPAEAPSLLRSRLIGFVSERFEARRLDLEGKRWYRDLYGEPNRAGWQSTQRQIVRMNRRMRERGGHFLLAAWPLLAGLEGEYPFAEVTQTIRRFCLEEGVPHHDLLPALRGRSSESLWVHPLDHHPNETAHHLAAASLAPALRGLAGP